MKEPTIQLKKLRERAGLSMAEIAKELGYKGASSYQRYEDPELFTKGILPLALVTKLLSVLPGRGIPPITKEEVTQLSGIHQQLGPNSQINDQVEPHTGFSEEAIEYTPPKNSILAQMLAERDFISTLKIKTDALNALGINDGDVIIFDWDMAKCKLINDQSEDAKDLSAKGVVANIYDKETGWAETIIRQYIWPDKLITNSKGLQNQIISLEDETLPFEIKIKGIILSSHRDL